MKHELIGRPYLESNQKRSIDLAVASRLLAFGMVPFMGAMALTRLVDGFSPIFSQSRVGKHGKNFTVHKLQSMPPNDNHRALCNVYDHPDATRLGSFWRATRVDEFPQLLSVLKGDMSMIGYRPLLPTAHDHMLKVLSPSDGRLANKMHYFMKPGIIDPYGAKHYYARGGSKQAPPTSQVNDIDAEKIRLRHEANVHYFKNASITYDLELMGDAIGILTAALRHKLAGSTEHQPYATSHLAGAISMDMPGAVSTAPHSHLRLIA